jgi:hypothetical protein
MVELKGFKPLTVMSTPKCNRRHSRIMATETLILAAPN